MTDYQRCGSPQFDYSAPPPREPKWDAFCFARDYRTGEVITLFTVCAMTDCEECIPAIWMAL